MSGDHPANCKALLEEQIRLLKRQIDMLDYNTDLLKKLADLAGAGVQTGERNIVFPLPCLPCT